MGEVWKEIPEFPGYSVSDTGRIMHWAYDDHRETYTRRMPQREITGAYSGGGYFSVGLYVDKKRRRQYIHILVAEAFVPKPAGTQEVDHIDEDKGNNYASNLRWVTRRQNMAKMLESNPHVIDNLKFRQGGEFDHRLR